MELDWFHSCPFFPSPPDPPPPKDYDGADSLIESEFLQLKELIIQLEVQLHTVKEQLHRVHSTRLRLLANIQERSRVSATLWWLMS